LYHPTEYDCSTACVFDILRRCLGQFGSAWDPPLGLLPQSLGFEQIAQLPKPFFFNLFAYSIPSQYLFWHIYFAMAVLSPIASSSCGPLNSPVPDDIEDRTDLNHWSLFHTELDKDFDIDDSIDAGQPLSPSALRNSRTTDLGREDIDSGIRSWRTFSNQFEQGLHILGSDM
jgi:hypothetical protein